MTSRVPFRPSRLAPGALAGFAFGLLAQVLPAASQDLVVKYDQSQLLRLPRPVSEIVIGNSTIADVTVQAPNLLVVTGKTFGITNVISLDAERNVIMDQRVVVVREETSVVNLRKGAKRESYNCTPVCNPSLVVGDDQAYFDQVVRTGERKIKFSESAADGGGSQSGAQ
ncbi:MAG: pilus assembly protein N-terminal domain-containing protein [Hyphomicrobiaceae bacterium]|nr:pilus assembly protein N-terminal domain-containing protein [Hyphomicrobiaceae bacterium]